MTFHPSTKYAPAAQPKNGKKKPASPTAVASFHFRLKTTGSSSAPARKVKTIAPMPERNLTQDSSVPRTADPIAAPMINCAIVPTTISDKAVETRSQIDSRLAIRARPNHNAASAHTPVIENVLPMLATCPALEIRSGNPFSIAHNVFRNGGCSTDGEHAPDDFKSCLKHKCKETGNRDCN